MYSFKIGTDPEYGILNSKTNSVYPPIALIKFDKINVQFNRTHPEHWIFSRLNNPPTLLHMDGAALELAIKPEKTPEKLWINLQKGINLAINTILPFKNLELSFLPTLDWDVNEYTIEKYGEEFIYSNRFGCDPDFDAFSDVSNKEQNEEDAEKHPYRYFGGHIHLGVPTDLLDKSKEIPDILAIICSVFWGNLCTYNSKYYDAEKLRLYRYGKPGRFRPQPHGIEYRSPSNSWTTNYDTVKEIFNSANAILTAFDNENFGTNILNLSEDTRKAIESFDVETCKKIYNIAKEMYDLL
jgi:hypothetical protein